MATDRDDEVYATLLLSDTYLPGALVLAHSLLDNGTTKKLAVLVTEDTVSREAIAQLQTVYHHVIPVPRIQTSRPQNLELMNRVDLHSAFTKIALWKQTQFSKIVYIDADVVAYRAPDELFDIDAPFSAAPDIGWPDIFNSGVMVLKPDLDEYASLLALAEEGVSFDGADQGLLNMHFGSNYNRISFTYNVTPSAHYQYIPAYKHFQSNINMVHFIGAQKPWFQGRPADTPPTSSNINDTQESSPHETMTTAWWNVYDRHYGQGEQDSAPVPEQNSQLVQYFVKGEFKPPAGAAPEIESSYYQEQQHPSYQGHEHRYIGRQDDSGYHPPPPPPEEAHDPPRTISHHDDQTRDSGIQPEPQPSSQPERPPPPPMAPVWDGSKQAPPANSKPEAPDFPETKYEMSEDSAHFIAPERYPSPPRDMWYAVPEERPALLQTPKPIFPWEGRRSPPTRVFAPEYIAPILMKPEAAPKPGLERLISPPRFGGEPAGPSTPTLDEPVFERVISPPRFGAEPTGPSTPTADERGVAFFDEVEEIDIPPTESPSLEPEADVSSPSQSLASPASPEPLEEGPPPMSDYWSSPTATNAWDDVPGIHRYIERVIDQTGLGGVRRQDILQSGRTSDREPIHLRDGPVPLSTRRPRREFFKITDFPSVHDRPSLPVTPSLPSTPRYPWRNVRYAEEGEEGEGEEEDETSPPQPPGPLQEAEGVPRQSEWNPVERLAKLAADPEALLRRLSEEVEGVPAREMVKSSEGLSGEAGKWGRSRAEGDSGMRRDSEARGGRGLGARSAREEVGKVETPLVAPVPLKKQAADPVGSLDEAASSIGTEGRVPSVKRNTGHPNMEGRVLSE
ncbi:related to glycogenin-2 beta [Cephalotrichum gorgonifer]|uniref:glycogenin glucosyltransferase n=1 Tax=Cephalotrichum gorgonifer TaxID=2041049 RepID=A0AAE8SS15_9PEZI|nr:related to glycogenin-2 beta [Cephalotrichum gorgonifer]